MLKLMGEKIITISQIVCVTLACQENGCNSDILPSGITPVLISLSLFQETPQEKNAAGDD